MITARCLGRRRKIQLFQQKGFFSGHRAKRMGGLRRGEFLGRTGSVTGISVAALPYRIKLTRHFAEGRNGLIG